MSPAHLHQTPDRRYSQPDYSRSQLTPTHTYTHTHTATREPYYSPVSEGRTPAPQSTNYDFYDTMPPMRDDVSETGSNYDNDNDDYCDDDGDDAGRRGKGVKWSSEEDLLLEELRRRRSRWCEVAKQFKGKSANACRKRYERIQQRKTITDKSAAEDRQRVAVAYWETREEMWKILEAKVPGMKWDKLERMCLEMGENDLKKRWKDAHNKPQPENHQPLLHHPSHGPLPGSAALGMGVGYPQASGASMQTLMAPNAESYGHSSAAATLVPQATSTYAMAPSFYASVMAQGGPGSHGHSQTQYGASMHHHAQSQGQAYGPDLLGAGQMANTYMTHAGVGSHYSAQRIPAADMGIGSLIHRAPVNM